MITHRATSNTRQASPTPASNRGVALVLALATLVIVSIAIAAAARHATLARSSDQLAMDERMTCDLLRAAEAPILRWLNAESHRVILPPDARTPEVAILNDQVRFEGAQWSLRITAWDQCGMAPIESLQDDQSPWRRAIPASMLAGFAPVERASSPPSGGQSPTREGLHTWPTNAHAPHAPERVFPRPSHFDQRASEFVTAAATRTSHDPNAATRHDSHDADTHAALAACVATPCAARNSSIDASQRLNIHTAPLATLRALFEATRRGGVGAIAQSRAAGRPFPIATLGEHHDALTLTTTSDAWAFRIDAGATARGTGGHGLVCRSWWVVYLRTDGQWQLALRWIIPA